MGMGYTKTEIFYLLATTAGSMAPSQAVQPRTTLYNNETT
jgi:hypothetical protein